MRPKRTSDYAVCLRATPPLAFLLFFYSFTCAFSNVCNYPDLSDPDEMFEAIGRENVCIPQPSVELNTYAKPISRENLGNGACITSIGASDDAARAVVVADGGIILSVGRTYNGSNNDFAVVKYFADGSLDTSFDTDGKLSLSFGTHDDIAHAAVLQSDGRLLIAGRSAIGGTNLMDFALLRILTTGALDTTFHTDGKLTTAVGTSADIARGIALDSSGRIIVGGYSNSTNYNSALARYLSDGSLDTTFHTDGKATYAITASDNSVFSVSIDSNGMIVGGGPTYDPGATKWRAGFLRVLTSGSLDTSFHTSGVLMESGCGLFTYDYNPNHSIAVGADNKIYSGGKAKIQVEIGIRFIVQRLLTDGSFDSSFNTRGEYSSAGTGQDAVVHSIALQTDGLTLLGAGTDEDPIVRSGPNFFVIKMKSNGTLDTSFSTNGLVYEESFGDLEYGQALALKGDGVIVVAGRFHNGSNYDFALLRYDVDGSLAQTGARVKSFGSSGYGIYDYATDVATGIIGDTSGRLVIVGQNNNNSNNAMVMRILQNGALDTSFNTTGKQEADGSGSGADIAQKATIQTDGKILLAGAFTGAGPRIGIARLETSGSLDTSFMTNGKYTMALGTSAYSVFVNTAAEILMVAKETTAADLMAVRLLTSGTLDTAFATDGSSTIGQGTVDLPNHAFLTPGQFLQSFFYAGAKNMGLIRWTTSGGLDTTFKTSGKFGQASGCSNALYIGTGGQAMAGFSNGASVVGLTCDTGGATYPNLLFKFTSDGRLDTSFKTSGSFESDSIESVAAASARAIVVTPNDKFYFQTNDEANHQFIIKRYFTDGSIDTTFSTDGMLSIHNTNVSPTGAVILNNGWYCGYGTSTSDVEVTCLWQ